jgi:cbb3-type cytochrome c oxidase subunit II
MFETKSGVLLIAGLGFFALAFVSNAVVPWVMYADRREIPVEELVNVNVLNQFRDLRDLYPEAFKKYYGEPTPESCAQALRLGREVYVGEGCWHCHSQFVRPVSNEEQRWGPVSKSGEYENELQRPVLFGTRRVGPDLSREAGRRGNDWHFLHFFRPRLTSPESVMPDYPWFFEGTTMIDWQDERGRPVRVKGPTAPNERGFAIITYMQWLGSWLDSYPHYRESDIIYRRSRE